MSRKETESKSTGSVSRMLEVVGKEDNEEIEHQIAYFARHLIKSRWESNKDTPDLEELDVEVFTRASKIHEWSKLVFEDSRARKR